MDENFTVRLAALMAERGLGVLALARKVPCDQAYVSRVVSGKQRPSRSLAQRLDEILGAGGRLAALAARSPSTRSAPRFPRDDDDVNRRELLRVLSTAGALMAGGPAGWDCLAPGARSRRPIPVGLDELSDLNAHLWRVFALARSKRLVYPLVRDQLSVMTGCLQRPASEARYRHLCALASDLFQLAGEIMFDGSRYTDAAHCYTLAAAAAREAGSPDLWACALTRHAFIGVYEGTPAGSVGMLDAAGNIACHGDRSLSTRYWVAAVQAEAYAGLGDLSACERALARAEEVQGLDGQVHNGGWLRFDGSRLAEERGTCYATLGRPDLAESALLSALAGNLSARRRGTVLTSLAITGVQRGDLDQAQQHASAAIGIAQETGSGVIMRKLAELHDALAACGADQRARDIRDEITAVTRA